MGTVARRYPVLSSRCCDRTSFFRLLYRTNNHTAPVAQGARTLRPGLAGGRVVPACVGACLRGRRSRRRGWRCLDLPGYRSEVI
jgi:hypothetical protein